MLILMHIARENSRNLKTGSATNARHVVITEYPVLLSNSITSLLAAFYTDHNTLHRARTMGYPVSFEITKI